MPACGSLMVFKCSKPIISILANEFDLQRRIHLSLKSFQKTDGYLVKINFSNPDNNQYEWF